MTSQYAIDFGRWMLTFAATFFFASTLLKTKWWRTNVGVNIFCLSITFVLTMLVINLAVYRILSREQMLWAFGGIYSAFGIVLVWRAITIWWLNRGFWAWTKEK